MAGANEEVSAKANHCCENDVHTEFENLDQKTMNQMDQIRKEIEESMPLVGEREDVILVTQDYAADDEVYQKKFRLLRSDYQWIRRTRGDGNCFFRAFGVALTEMIQQNTDEYDRIYKIIKDSKARLISLGYQEFTVEDFHETVLNMLDNVRNGATTRDEVITWFNDPELSNYFVVYFRLLTSAHLKENAVFFENFLEGYQSVQDFCSNEVEPMGKESDHIHIIALTTTLRISIEVVYINSTKSDIYTHHFPESTTPQFTLLYRPGHYDVLYR